jgi:type I restriction enzyme S subunit
VKVASGSRPVELSSRIPAPALEALDSAPGDWRVERLKYHTRLNPDVLAESTPADTEISYIDISSVDRRGRVATPLTLVFGSAPSRARRVVRHGDTIVSTVRTYLRAVAQIPKEMDGFICSTGFAVLRPDESLVPRYLYYWASSTPFIEEVVARSVGVSYPAINATAVVDIVIPVPPVSSQRAICDFLDGEISVLDAVLERKERLRGHLLERQNALVDSLVEGSGEAIRVKFCTTRITSGPRGWADYRSDEGTMFLRITNVARNSVELLMDDVMYVNAPPGSERERTRVRAGDVLISITADVGWTGIARPGHADANVSQHLALLRPELERCRPEWLALALRTSGARAQFDAARYGGTKQQLALDDVADIRIPVPDVAEQDRRLERINDQARVLEALRSVLERQVALLQARRRDLITAGVTGRLGAGV